MSTNGTQKPQLEYTIRPVPPAALRQLRHEVLWPSIPIEAQLAEYDHAPGALHLGLFLPPSQLRELGIPAAYDSLPVGIVTLVPTPYRSDVPLPPALLSALSNTDGTDVDAEWSGEPATQLRKFALHPALQGRGLGRVMFDAAVGHLKQDRPQLLHLDARTEQTGFYERLGLAVLDPKVFTKVGPNGDGPAIPHLRMGCVI